MLPIFALVVRAQRAVEDFGWLQPGEMIDGNN
jgi:hypothetical protein